MIDRLCHGEHAAGGCNVDDRGCVERAELKRRIARRELSVAAVRLEPPPAALHRPLGELPQIEVFQFMLSSWWESCQVRALRMSYLTGR
jgi:hypothetical protein